MAARRTVSVALEVKAADARKDIRATRDDLGKLTGSAKVAGKSLDDMAEEATRTGRKLDDMAEKAAKADRKMDDMAAGTRLAKTETAAYKRELGQLDRQIDATILHMKALGRQFAATGDKSLLKAFAADQSLLRRMQRIRQELNVSPGTAGGFLNGISASPALIAAAAAAAVAIAPAFGAAVGGAVLGGVGIGGIIGGITAAAHDGRVRDAYAELGHGLAASLHEAGRPFLGPLLHEVSTLGAAAYSGINILREGFEKLAPVVRPLALGIDGFVEALGPGLKQAFGAAAPAIRVLANELPEIGSALSDALAAISRDSDGAIEGFIGLLHATEDLIRGTGEFVGWLSRAFEMLVRVSNASATVLANWMQTFRFLEAIPGVGTALGLVRQHVEDARDETFSLMDGMRRAGDTSKDFSYSLDGTADSADEAAQKVKDLTDRIDDLFAAQLSWDQANIDLRQGMRDLVEELTHGKRTLSETSAEGDKNREAIIRQVKEVVDAAEAYRRWSGDIAGANRQRDTELEKIRAVLIQLGYNRQAVNEIVDAYKKIPAKASVPVEAPGLATVQSRLDKVNTMLDRIDGRVATTYVRTVFGEFRAGERNPSANRWGGVYERAADHAAAGLLREAAVYSAQNPARYAYAEPSTGGEAFIPRRGDATRSMGILNHAAGWYGASVVPYGGYQRAAASAPAPVYVNVNVTAGGGAGELARALVSTLRTEVTALGGDVQQALGNRPYVYQARTSRS